MTPTIINRLFELLRGAVKVVGPVAQIEGLVAVGAGAVGGAMVLEIVRYWKEGLVE